MMPILMVSSAAASAVGGSLAGIAILVVVVISIGIYFVPTIIAFVRNKSNKIAILALNFLLGWSLIGWVVSLVWALSNEQPAAPQQVIVYNTPPAEAPRAQDPS